MNQFDPVFCLFAYIVPIQGCRHMLTERQIRDVKPKQKTCFLWDEQVKGLGVRITPKGAKSYVLFYRAVGQKHLATLARTSETSLKVARDRAGQELAAIRVGKTGLLERLRRSREAPTINDGLDRFFDEYVPDRIATGRMTQSTATKYRNQANSYLRSAFGKRRIADITRLDVENMAKRLKFTPTLRNRVLAFTSRLFNLFEIWEWREQHTNPVRGVDRAREEARDRILSPSEIAALAKALTASEFVNPASIAAIRFAAVTGLRIGEILAIKWQHIDFETGRLLLPQTKTGRRFHDLPSAALAILVDIPRINKWVFTTGRGDSPVMYRTVRKHFASIAYMAGLEDVRLHDLRRTVMTQAAAAGIGTHVLRDLLGHKTTVMADRYIRAVGSPVRDAREQVGAAMAAMMNGEDGEVVLMERRHG